MDTKVKDWVQLHKTQQPTLSNRIDHMALSGKDSTQLLGYTSLGWWRGVARDAPTATRNM